MDIRRFQIIMGWVFTGSLVAIGGADAADRPAPGVVRIRAQSPYDESRVHQTGAEEPVPDPNIKGAETDDLTVDADGDYVECEDDYGYGRGRWGRRGCCGWCGGMGCGFCNTQPWWFGSRQIGPLRWLLCDGYCTVSPGHGWARPYKVPVRRIGVGYTRFYGEPLAVPAPGTAPAAVPVPTYPMIYTPTDTTQLGFYYQHVPMWRDQPHLYPATPAPGHYHYRHCKPGHACGAYGTGEGFGSTDATDVSIESAAKTAGIPQGSYE